MSRSFQKVAYLFFISFGLVYLGADFLLNQQGIQSDTLTLIYQTFDMPFFFCGGMYLLASIVKPLQKRTRSLLVPFFFWAAVVAWTVFLLYLNLGFESFL